MPDSYVFIVVDDDPIAAPTHTLNEQAIAMVCEAIMTAVPRLRKGRPSFLSALYQMDTKPPQDP